MTAVGIADEVDDIADLEAGVCQQLLGLSMRTELSRS